ncbi:putative protein kinase RLK-Pelle-CrRLK1L-1 family transcription factor bHLH family [Helianthus annuus]|nr:putative protein kinase RLK-Pelle-CrRLK1L-1 family transcription factor bHLH family [Helianthus annuus]
MLPVDYSIFMMMLNLGFSTVTLKTVAAEHSFLISNPCGTYGYIDPEYSSTGCLTQKSDVFSFGVVLFEVLCGRPTRVRAFRDERQFLTNLIKIHWRRKTLDEIIYPDLQKQINGASLVTFSSIAYQCLMSGNERPTMKKVVEQLQKALDEQLLDGDGKPLKTLTLENENPESKPKVETSTGKKAEENSVKLPEPPKQDYIHVRARRGQATDSDSHSLAERVIREKIEERMKILQDLVPGCNKVTGKALMLDEIINYVQSLQRQVEFLSFRMARDNGPSPEWLHMQISGSFDERST